MIDGQSAMTDREAMAYLRGKLGEERALLVDRFFELGRAGEKHADKSWELLGLDTSKRTKIGLGLQALLEAIDQQYQQSRIDEVHGVMSIDKRKVGFVETDGDIKGSFEGMSVSIN